LRRDKDFWEDLRDQLFPGYSQAVFRTVKTEAGNFIPLPKLYRMFASVLPETTLRALVAITCHMDGPSMLAEIDLDELALEANLSRVSNLLPHLDVLQKLSFIATSEGKGAKRRYVLLLHPWLAAKRLVEDGYFADARKLNALNELLIAMRWDPVSPTDRKLPIGLRPRRRPWTRPSIERADEHASETGISEQKPPVIESDSAPSFDPKPEEGWEILDDGTGRGTAARVSAFIEKHAKKNPSSDTASEAEPASANSHDTRPKSRFGARWDGKEGNTKRLPVRKK
jgi:hypothetical protein